MACGGAASEPDAAPGSPDAPAAPVDAAAADAPVDAPPPDAPPPDADPTMPMRLSDTGLYTDVVAETLADGVRAYAPRFPLWSDGAVKRRWVYLPPGSTIDTADMDFWRFPVGTKLWKEFVRDGVRVETRLLMKTAPDAWFMMAYAWLPDGSDAIATPYGQPDALGTDHDIPSVSDCDKCHGRVPDVALGFSALQLDHADAGVSLTQLAADGLITDPPAAPLVVPGDATAAAALGYLHANCGTCHNDTSDVSVEHGLRLYLTVGALGAVKDTPAYTTAVGVAPVHAIAGVTALIEPGNPEASAVHARMATRGPIRMPPIASEVVDGDGLAAVDAWIASLP